MHLRVHCPAGHTLKVPMHRAGTDVRCPACGVTVSVPKEAKVVIVPLGASSFALKQAAVMPPVSKPLGAVRPPPLPGSEARPNEQLISEPLDDELSALADVFAVAPTNGQKEVRSSAAPAATVKTEAAVTQSETPRRGYEPDAHRRRRSYLVSVGLVAIGLLGLVPSLMAFSSYLSAERSLGLPNWALVILLVSGIQLAYAFFLSNVPDWSTAWMATGAALAGTAIYSMVLSLSLMGSGATHLVQLLQLGDEVRNTGAARWCALMVCISLAVTYFSGSFALRWYRAYRMMAELV